MTRSKQPLSAFYLAAFLLPFCSAGFVAFFTGSIWEDGLITLRQAMNWVNGQGLTYNPLEKVHGFTSPFNVLFLSLFYKLFGKTDPLNAIYAYRILSMVLLGGTGILILRMFRANGEKSWVLPFFAVAALSLDIKTMLFSINGQEPAFTVFFLSLAVVAALHETAKTRMVLMVLAISGLQWNRPEGFVYAAGLIAGDVWRTQGEMRRKRWKEYLRVVPISILLYLPWLIFTTWYYGSPVPNTIYAKGGSVIFSTFAHKVLVSPLEVSASALGPIYFLSSSNLIVAFFSSICVLFSCSYVFFARKDSLGCIASGCALFSYAYLSLVAATSHNYPWPWPFPWYYPPLTFSVVLTLASALSKAMVFGEGRWVRIVSAVAIFILVMMVGLYVTGTRSVQYAQANIEANVRKPIGHWLYGRVQPGETIFCECIGYIGFYSGATILDYPGLTSRKTVEVRRREKLDFYGTLRKLKANWLVLRITESEEAGKRHLLEDYDVVERFALPEELQREKNFQELNPDGYFVVYKRRDKIEAR